MYYTQMQCLAICFGMKRLRRSWWLTSSNYRSSNSRQSWMLSPQIGKGSGWLERICQRLQDLILMCLCGRYKRRRPNYGTWVSDLRLGHALQSQRRVGQHKSDFAEYFEPGSLWPSQAHLVNFQEWRCHVWETLWVLQSVISTGVQEQWQGPPALLHPGHDRKL